MPARELGYHLSRCPAATPPHAHRVEPFTREDDLPHRLPTVVTRSLQPIAHFHPADFARGIAHLAEHGFAERAQRVQFVAGGEMDAGNLVDDVAQEVTALHAIIHALEHGGDDIAAVVAMELVSVRR